MEDFKYSIEQLTFINTLANNQNKEKDDKEESKGFFSRILGWASGNSDKNVLTEKENEKDKEKDKSFAEKQIEQLSLDVQVQACVNMISLLNLAKDNVKNRPDMLKFLQKNYLTDTPTLVKKVKQ